MTTTSDEPRYRFSGPQGPGAMRQHREQRRRQADNRNAQTQSGRRRWRRQVDGLSDETRAGILASRSNPTKTARIFGVSPVTVQFVWLEGRDEA